MLQHYKKLFQLDRQLYHRGQYHNDHSILLAANNLTHHSLHNLGGLQEPMEVFED